LRSERNQPSGCEHEADVELRPMMGRKINGNERSETGLNIGQKEGEPIKAAGAGAR
jgi:hypothetical protein